ncbi:glycosyltransferase family 87 protein [Phenylobacterium montanum]|uniref:DUF2029 domain-containing protein n=1 Tax=Phenylobacterium montanum TaxID=2823693 RepID=A0A975IV55_9CAUL|nr:glycosyltransferase family 87 protein [Caulobacter sp. S6]QUD88488.1 DUF2029 domain-containing protein [Caulobacter sp. S6]
MTQLSRAMRDADWLTLERLKRWTPLFALVSVLLLGLDVWTHTRFGVVDGKGEQVGRDFVNYWAGARLAIQGRAGQAYDLHRFLAYERSLTAPNAEAKWYGYPPVAMVLAAPFAFLPFLPALLAWTLSGWAVLARMQAPRMGWLLAGCALIATPAFYIDALSGQNGAFSAALLVGGLMLLDERPLLAGALFGLLCYKPHLGIMIPVALVAAGRWRAIFGGALAGVALVAVSVAMVGVQPWTAFLHNAPFHRQILETQIGNWPRMPSVYVALRFLGAASPLAYAAQAASALAAAAAVFVAWRGRASAPLKGAVLLVATFLTTPYAWDYDMVALLFAAVWVWREAEAGGWRPWERIGLAVMLASPWVLPATARRLHLQLGPVILWWVLALLLARIAAKPAVSGSLGDAP